MYIHYLDMCLRLENKYMKKVREFLKLKVKHISRFDLLMVFMFCWLIGILWQIKEMG